VKRSFKKNFRSDLRAAKQTVTEALKFLRDAVPCMRDDQLSDLRLVFNELLVNAVIHGNRQDSGKTVSIEIDIDGEYLYSRVSDEGMGFDYNKMAREWNAEGNLLNE